LPHCASLVHGGAPQLPFVHAKPDRHCASLVHEAAQVPFWHAYTPQSESPWQGSGVHFSPRHCHVVVLLPFAQSWDD
jgi:hypothetical protein